jgi:predicted nucleic acid-binding protein
VVTTPAPLGRHRRVLIDSSVWIYHFEQHAQFARAAGRVIQLVEEGRFRGVVSELTLLELTVRPLQLARQDIADEYELLLSHFPNVELEPVTREILLDAATLRAKYRLRTPDAIVLATGIRSSATVAVTNDRAWKTVQAASLEVVLLSEL